MILPLIAGLTLKTATGGTEILFPAKDRRATVVYVVLAECPIARGYSPEMARIAKDYSAKGVRFVMAFADGDAATWRSQMKAYRLPFPAAKADQRFMNLVKATTAPTAALIGADGKIAYVGRIDDRFPALGIQRKPRRPDLRLAIDQFLAGKPVRPSRTDVIGCVLPSL